MVAVWDVRRLLHRETYLVGRERQSQNEEIDSTTARSKYPIFPTSCRHLLAVDKEAGLAGRRLSPLRGSAGREQNFVGLLAGLSGKL